MNKRVFILFIFVLSAGFYFLNSCKKDPGVPFIKPLHPPLEGGKGGPFYVTIFPKYRKKGVDCVVSIRYGANAFPKDSLFSENQYTKSIPDSIPKAEFVALKKGYYYIYASDGKWFGDTVLYFKDGDSNHSVYPIQFKH